MLEKYDSGRANSMWNIVSGDETWVYQFDPETKALSSVWLFPGDNLPLKFKRSRSTSCPVHCQNRTHHNHSTGGKAHCDQRLVCASMPAPSATCCTYPTSIVRHHPSSCQCPFPPAAATREFLASEGVQLMSHPPYSPDLSPCDFFLFPHVKKHLPGTCYDSPQDAIRAFTRAIDSIDKVTWSEVWKSWFQRMVRGIKAQGGYFEKLA